MGRDAAVFQRNAPKPIEYAVVNRIRRMLHGSLVEGIVSAYLPGGVAGVCGSKSGVG